MMRSGPRERALRSRASTPGHGVVVVASGFGFGGGAGSSGSTTLGPAAFDAVFVAAFVPGRAGGPSGPHPASARNDTSMSAVPTARGSFRANEDDIIGWVRTATTAAR